MKVPSGITLANELKEMKTIKKEANCNVISPAAGCGVPCAPSLKQPGCSTSGPRNHLKRKHPKQWTEFYLNLSRNLNLKIGSFWAYLKNT